MGDARRNVNSRPVVIVTTSWDDGDPTDLKMGEVLSEYGIRATFYLAPQNRERAVISAAEMRSLGVGFEIGSHSMTHPVLCDVGDAELREEVARSKIELEDIVGKSVCMFAYPRGRYDRRIQDAVAGAGYLGARTIRERGVRLPMMPFQMSTTVSAYPFAWWIRMRHALRTVNLHDVATLYRVGIGRGWVEWSLALFEEALQKGGVWHLWGHSWEVEKLGLWRDLCTIFKSVANAPNVLYLTNGEVIRKLFGLGKPGTPGT